ncbi:MAG: hypothetical protein FVQ84_10305 [Planctomycetes bacterium]|nr:hypothetical protein [Planctomycetota bacterium]
MNTILADTTIEAVRKQFEILRRIWPVIKNMREIIMCLSRDERNVLRYLYKNLDRDAISGTVKLQLARISHVSRDKRIEL